MEYETPTTVEELMDTLREIYKFYRIRKQDFYVPELPKINLVEIEYEKMTEEEISNYARELLAGKHSREILERRLLLENEILKNTEKINVLRESQKESEKEIVNLYRLKADGLEQEALKNGLLTSSIIAQKKLTLFKERDKELEELSAKINKEISELQGEIAVKEELLSGVEQYFQSVHESELVSKIAELKEKENTHIKDVIKYNNTVQEKNIKYSNYVDNARATLQLKYIEMRMVPYSKDELVELGYYGDVMMCIYEYFKSVDPKNAYSEFLYLPDIMMYLEDFYDAIADFYRRVSNEANAE